MNTKCTARVWGRYLLSGYAVLSLFQGTFLALIQENPGLPIGRFDY